VKGAQGIRYDQIANFLGAKLNPSHGQTALFTDHHSDVTSIEMDAAMQLWAGVDMRVFMAFISSKTLRQVLDCNRDVFSDSSENKKVKLVPMEVNSSQIQGKKRLIYYDFFESMFGNMIIGSSSKGVCHLMFYQDIHEALRGLQQQFPNAQIIARQDRYQDQVKNFLAGTKGLKEGLTLHLQGTPFQFQVWQALLNIPSGVLSTYGAIAKYLKNPLASRAVGTAVGANPIAVLIPCHRVLGASGSMGQYRWGTIRKMALIGWEAVKIHTQKSEKLLKFV
jgi:AraC family transcriptional regulator of adaptative response/methylated-DNA-[protein]-cysteine methyltransferase|tara:strand:+ start:127 stop:963 length:837 start_codon:yes stop_codon:yes gene_type:complete